MKFRPGSDTHQRLFTSPRPSRPKQVSSFLDIVIPYLDGKSLLACSEVSKLWNAECNSIAVWRRLVDLREDEMKRAGVPISTAPLPLSLSGFSLKEMKKLVVQPLPRRCPLPESLQGEVSKFHAQQAQNDLTLLHKKEQQAKEVCAKKADMERACNYRNKNVKENLDTDSLPHINTSSHPFLSTSPPTLFPTLSETGDGSPNPHIVSGLHSAASRARRGLPEPTYINHATKYKSHERNSETNETSDSAANNEAAYPSSSSSNEPLWSKDFFPSATSSQRAGLEHANLTDAAPFSDGIDGGMNSVIGGQNADDGPQKGSPLFRVSSDIRHRSNSNSGGRRSSYGGEGENAKTPSQAPLAYQVLHSAEVTGNYPPPLPAPEKRHHSGRTKLHHPRSSPPKQPSSTEPPQSSPSKDFSPPPRSLDHLPSLAFQQKLSNVDNSLPNAAEMAKVFQSTSWASGPMPDKDGRIGSRKGSTISPTANSEADLHDSISGAGESKPSSQETIVSPQPAPPTNINTSGRRWSNSNTEEKENVKIEAKKISSTFSAGLHIPFTPPRISVEEIKGQRPTEEKNVSVPELKFSYELVCPQELTQHRATVLLRAFNKLSSMLQSEKTILTHQDELLEVAEAEMPSKRFFEAHEECMRLLQQLRLFEEVVCQSLLRDASRQQRSILPYPPPPRVEGSRPPPLLPKTVQSFVQMELLSIKCKGSPVDTLWTQFKTALPLDEQFYNVRDFLLEWGPEWRPGQGVVGSGNRRSMEDLLVNMIHQQVSAYLEPAQRLIALRVDWGKYVPWDQVMLSVAKMK